MFLAQKSRILFMNWNLRIFLQVTQTQNLRFLELASIDNLKEK